MTGSTRLTDLPDMPTFAELELPEAEGGSWQGLLATAGTPDAIIAQVNEAIAQIVQMEDVQQSILNLGAVVSTGTPEELDGWIDENVTRWAEVIEANNISL